jgi:YggT family protein
LAALLEAFLLARLVLRLFAARPDNPAVAAIYWLTEPWAAALAVLDAGQPQFGAVLEFSTLAWCVGIPVVWAIVARRLRPAASRQVREPVI